MKRTLLFLFLLIPGLEGYSCMMHPGKSHFFYELLRQDLVGPKNYADFLRDDAWNRFYSRSDRLKGEQAGNLALWKDFLGGKMSRGTIEKALRTEKEDRFEAIWEKRDSEREKAAEEYIRYARECSKAFEYRSSGSWSYGDILEKGKKKEIKKLVAEGLKAYKRADEEQLQKRYAYQVVRALHYAGRYEEAVKFFDDELKGRSPRDEIYYYTLDQVAGCLYSLEEYEDAAHRFLRVFGKSKDRKKSAFNSYDFCLEQGADGRSLFKGKEDEAIHIVLQSLRNPGSDLDRIGALYEAEGAPSGARIKLLFTRAIYDIEHKAWPKRLARKGERLPRIQELTRSRIARMDSLTRVFRKNSKGDERAFWDLSASYLQFLRGDLDRAEELLAKVDRAEYQDQKASLSRLYEVFSWKQLDAKKEERLVDMLEEDLLDVNTKGAITRDLYPSNGWTSEPDWKYAVLDQVGHLYYKDGDLAKAFLTHNRLQNTHELASHTLVDSLLRFLEKNDGTPFERLLRKRAISDAEGKEPIAHLRYVKGSYYLKSAEPKLALTEFQRARRYLENKQDPGEFEWNTVSGWVFSNNTKECFGCPETEIMEDSIFLHEAYPFLEDRPMRIEELAEAMIKLDSMTRKAEEWKRKLAHYLRGNFYYNMTTSGYYRGALTGKGNCCNYEHGERPTQYEKVLKERSGYNLFDFNSPTLYHGLAKEALKEYEKVLERSENRELNARTLYMMAKCELNIMYSEDWDELKGERLTRYQGNYDGGLNKAILEYKSSFDRLHRKYRNTDFYDEIIEECGFFEHYVAERY